MKMKSEVFNIRYPAASVSFFLLLMFSVPGCGNNHDGEKHSTNNPDEERIHDHPLFGTTMHGSPCALTTCER